MKSIPLVAAALLCLSSAAVAAPLTPDSGPMTVSGVIQDGSGGQGRFSVSASLKAGDFSGTLRLSMGDQSFDGLRNTNTNENPRTPYDWLSRDDAEVDAYIDDPACGFGVAAAGLAGMLQGTAGAADPERLGAIRADLPILIVSGDADPLAGGGALVELVGQRYRDAGVKDVTGKLYPGARHEIFNETNRDEVTADLIAWLDDVVAGAGS